MIETMKLRNPLANHRLQREHLRPQGHYCLVRIDPFPKQTAGGLLIPEQKLDGQFVGHDRRAPAFKHDMTAVVLAIGPDVDNAEVGDRVLVTSVTLPVSVADGDEDHPLGLFDARDICCKVAS